MNMTPNLRTTTNLIVGSVFLLSDVVDLPCPLVVEDGNSWFGFRYFSSNQDSSSDWQSPVNGEMGASPLWDRFFPFFNKSLIFLCAYYWDLIRRWQFRFLRPINTSRQTLCSFRLSSGCQIHAFFYFNKLFEILILIGEIIFSVLHRIGNVLKTHLHKLNKNVTQINNEASKTAF